MVFRSQMLVSRPSHASAELSLDKPVNHGVECPATWVFMWVKHQRYTTHTMQGFALCKTVINASWLEQESFCSSITCGQRAVEFAQFRCCGGVYFVLPATGGKWWKSRLFLIERRLEWGMLWVSESVECEGKHGVAKIFAKASWRAANQRCYSGKLAGTQNHLELIMACPSARGACEYKHTLANTQQHTNKNCMCCTHTPPPAPTHVRSNIRCPTEVLAL